jgi:hypothetical protein
MMLMMMMIVMMMMLMKMKMYRKQEAVGILDIVMGSRDSNSDVGSDVVTVTVM